MGAININGINEVKAFITIIIRKCNFNCCYGKIYKTANNISNSDDSLRISNI